MAMWIMLLILLMAGMVTGGGLVLSMAASERCVTNVLRASSIHLSTWEAVESCQKRTP